MDYANEFQDIDFQKYWLILKRGKKTILGVFTVVVSLGLLYALLSKPQYKSEAKLLVKTSLTPSLTGLGGDIGKIEPLTDQGDPLNAQVEILLSNKALKQTIEELKLTNNQGESIPIAKLEANINVDATEGTDVLKVSYIADDPEMSAAVVQKLIDIYIEQNIRDNRAEAAAAKEFILKQLPQSEKTVKKAELALRQFKEINGITYLTEESSASIHVINDLKEKISDARSQLVDVTARLDNLKRQTNLQVDEAATLAALSQVPGVQKILTEVQNAESQLAIEQARFQPQNPTIVNLTEKIADLKKLLQEKIRQQTGSNQQINWNNLQVGDIQESQVRDLVLAEKERIGLEQRIAEMNNSLSRYRQESRNWPRLEQEIEELKRKVKASQITYETLLTRLQEIDVAVHQNMGNIRVISPPLVPEKPFDSHKRIIVLASGVLGLLLGVGVTLVVDITDKSLKTVEEAKQLFPYTLLTTIPHLNRNTINSEMMDTELVGSELVSSDRFDYQVSDAYQLLQANLSFCSEEPPKVITFTSSVPNEGKSRICANLAVTIAQGNHRVLLIDGNLRNPAQHKIWGLNNALGLINLLLNHVSVNNMMIDDVPVEAAIDNVMPNLDVITSGGTFSHTLALLQSVAMDTLVKKFRQEYDVVIFDAPSLKGQADAGIMGKLSDGIVMVVRPGVADLESINEAQEFLKNSRQNVLGMVVNEAKIDRAEPQFKAIASIKQLYLKSHSESLNV